MILAAAALSFIGLGAQPPTAEWGLMISDGKDYILQQWWIGTFAGRRSSSWSSRSTSSATA